MCAIYFTGQQDTETVNIMARDAIEDVVSFRKDGLQNLLSPGDEDYLIEKLSMETLGRGVANISEREEDTVDTTDC